MDSKTVVSYIFYNLVVTLYYLMVPAITFASLTKIPASSPCLVLNMNDGLILGLIRSNLKTFDLLAAELSLFNEGYSHLSLCVCIKILILYVLLSTSFCSVLLCWNPKYCHIALFLATSSASSCLFASTFSTVCTLDNHVTTPCTCFTTLC